MRTYDLSPLYRSTVGFDRMASLIDRALSAENTSQSYPPYNIEKTGDDAYRITLAAAGFSEGELSIESRESQVVISGSKQAAEPQEGVEVLHRGIAARSFERRFQLADHVKVVSASLEHGLLHVDLVREVPEALKPRTIQIATGSPKVTIEQQAA
jgi:molecular chaperone IbpA